MLHVPYIHCCLWCCAEGILWHVLTTAQKITRSQVRGCSVLPWVVLLLQGVQCGRSARECVTHCLLDTNHSSSSLPRFNCFCEHAEMYS
jgi:hypothetical protein